MTTNSVIIPQSAIDDIEQARQDLYKLLSPMLDGNIKLQMEVQNVTARMWTVANTKWPEAPQS